MFKDKNGKPVMVGDIIKHRGRDGWNRIYQVIDEKAYFYHFFGNTYCSVASYKILVDVIGHPRKVKRVWLTQYKNVEKVNV